MVEIPPLPIFLKKHEVFPCDTIPSIRPFLLKIVRI